MSLETKILLTTDKPMFDVNDKWLPNGNYSFKIISYSEESTVKGDILAGPVTGRYEFKYFSIIKLMAKAQSRLARRTQLQLEITNYPSPSNSPMLQTKSLISPHTAHRVSPVAINTCRICFEKCSNKIACGHYFHKKCIARWMRDTPSCPVCRATTGRVPT